MSGYYEYDWDYPGNRDEGPDGETLEEYQERIAEERVREGLI